MYGKDAIVITDPSEIMVDDIVESRPRGFDVDFGLETSIQDEKIDGKIVVIIGKCDADAAQKWVF